MNTQRTRLAEFAIETDLGTTRTNELYANGRHDCKLFIRVAKQVEDAAGRWSIVALTDAEKASATIVEYSTNPFSGLPAGWSCKHKAGQYDAGLWQQGRKHDQPVQSTVPTRASVAPVELLERYLSFAPNHPIQAKRFMASIRIDGKVYTTNYTDEDSQFQSHVEVTPTRPHAVRVAQLQRFVHKQAYVGDRDDIYAYVFYWQAPRGLLIVQSLGITEPLQVPDEGTHFQTSLNVFEFKGGVAVGKDEPGATLFLSQVKRNVYPDKDPEIEFNLQPTAMRVVVLKHKASSNYQISTGTWGLIDNFGCEHHFKFRFGNHDYPVELTD
jgi:hypothetical protein